MGVPLEELVFPVEIDDLIIQVHTIAMENMGEGNEYIDTDYPVERDCRKLLVCVEKGPSQAPRGPS